MIEQNTKFSFANPRQTKQFKEQEFFAWTSNNFYRTSYNDMRDKVSCVDPRCGPRLGCCRPNCLTYASNWRQSRGQISPNLEINYLFVCDRAPAQGRVPSSQGTPATFLALTSTTNTWARERPSRLEKSSSQRSSTSPRTHSQLPGKCISMKRVHLADSQIHSQTQFISANKWNP